MVEKVNYNECEPVSMATTDYPLKIFQETIKMGYENICQNQGQYDNKSCSEALKILKKLIFEVLFEDHF